MASNKVAIANDLFEKVNELLPEAERPLIFEALKRYQSSMDLKRLISDMKIVLNEPTKLEIYEYMRPLIPPKHQSDYDKLAPAPPGRKLRAITLRKRANESFGFAVRGGFEHGVGVFVSHINPGSQAEQKGLRVGDEIVRVNGYTIAEAVHEEVLNLIKGQDEIELKVTNIGMLPVKERATDPLTWSYVDKTLKGGKGTSENLKRGSDEKAEEVKLFVNLRQSPSLGCRIVSGPSNYRGIFVEHVNPGSMGAEVGIEAGDQIVSVNGTSFLNISHQEAIVALKSSKELNIIIRKGVGLPLFAAAGEPSKPKTQVTKAQLETHPSDTGSVLELDNWTLRGAESEMETELILAELARLRWKQRRMSGRSFQKQEAVEDTDAEDMVCIVGMEEKEALDENNQEQNEDPETAPSKSMDYLTVPNQHLNNTPHQKKKLIRHDSLNVDDAPVKVESSSKDFLSVPSHLHPNDTLGHQKKNSRNTDSNEDLTGNTEADIEDTFLEIPSSPFEVDSNTHVEAVSKERAPMEDLVKQLTEDQEDDENDINLDRDIQGKKNTLQTRQIKSNSLRMPEKDRRAKLDVFSTEDRSPVLKRRNSDTSRRKKGKESKVVQFVEDEPELIDSRKSSLKLKSKEKTSTKRGEIEPGLEKLKLLEEIQQLREEKLHEVERRKELENTLESMKNWETTQRLQKVLDEKKKKQAREAEKLRQEMFESNRKRRQGLEKELLLKVSRNRKERERMIRYQRQKQEQEEMLREGAMSNFVQSMLHMWRPHLSPRSSVKEQDSVEVQEPEKGINLTEHIEDHLYSRIYKSSSSSTLPSDRSQGKTKQKKRKDKLLSRKSASFDLSTPSYDLELYERSIDLHPDLNVSSQIDDDLLNSYDLAQSGHPSNNVVTTTVCV